MGSLYDVELVISTQNIGRSIQILETKVGDRWVTLQITLESQSILNTIYRKHRGLQQKWHSSITASSHSDLGASGLEVPGGPL